MPHDLPDSNRRLTALYERGLLTQHESHIDSSICSLTNQMNGSLTPSLMFPIHSFRDCVRNYTNLRTRITTSGGSGLVTRGPKIRFMPMHLLANPP